MPSNQDYLSWKIVIGAKVVPYGLFIGDVVNFTIISLVVFIFIVKVLGGLTKFKQAEVQTAAVAPPAITKDQELLTEIRDLLKKE
jgi:large conductance mechanosensitive channel